MNFSKIVGTKLASLFLIFMLLLSGCATREPKQNNLSNNVGTNRESASNLRKVSYKQESEEGGNWLNNVYYKDAGSKSGEELKRTLHQIISKQDNISYEEAYGALDETDQDQNNQNNVILFYTGRSESKSRKGGERDDWNREHVWAQSHFKNNVIKSDLHNLKPADVSVNGTRGNLDFDTECDQPRRGQSACTKDQEAPDTYYDQNSWEPRDEIKGDVARILFYMAVRYEGEDGKPNLELLDKVGTSAPYHGKLSTLLKWHKEDPVDDFERRRNNIIYEKYQHNRNPFIDHPEWVESIWR
ncbi:endonuclease I family protein [Priestia megaterium]|uniref:endonuclease I family protein n=1 Tax=Priestia megaterium TaxID=1404 RepID=UPI00263BE37E|nr:endonuclease [Priestia megaterium]MDN4862808.1 endonuclease [Priestia megaterium]